MKKPKEDERSRIALLRYEVIASLLNRPLPRGAQSVLMEELTSQMHIDAKNRLVHLGKITSGSKVAKLIASAPLTASPTTSIPGIFCSIFF